MFYFQFCMDLHDLSRKASCFARKNIQMSAPPWLNNSLHFRATLSKEWHICGHYSIWKYHYVSDVHHMSLNFTSRSVHPSSPGTNFSDLWGRVKNPPSQALSIFLSRQRDVWDACFALISYWVKTREEGHNWSHLLFQHSEEAFR